MNIFYNIIILHTHIGMYVYEYVYVYLSSDGASNIRSSRDVSPPNGHRKPAFSVFFNACIDIPIPWTILCADVSFQNLDISTGQTALNHAFLLLLAWLHPVSPPKGQ